MKKQQSKRVIPGFGLTMGVTLAMLSIVVLIPLASLAAVFIVSQRATSIKQADKILVLDDGELAGVGTHKELMESCEVYREICLSQLSEQEVNR